MTEFLACLIWGAVAIVMIVTYVQIIKKVNHRARLERKITNDKFDATDRRINFLSEQSIKNNKVTCVIRVSQDNYWYCEHLLPLRETDVFKYVDRKFYVDSTELSLDENCDPLYIINVTEFEKTVTYKKPKIKR